MEGRIVDIVTVNNMVSGTFLTNDVSEANMLRRALLTEIETFAIDIVIYHVNTSARRDEALALRFGQLVIDNEKFVPDEKGEFKTTLDFTGPGTLTSDHIPGLPFANKTPLAELKAGQRVWCDLIVKKGKGDTHVKWRPLALCSPPLEVPGGYKITFKEIGMLPGHEIFRRGFDKMKQAAQRPAINLFFQPLIPANLV